MKFTPESGKTTFFFIKKGFNFSILCAKPVMQFHPLAYDEIELGRTKGN